MIHLKLHHTIYGVLVLLGFMVFVTRAPRAVTGQQSVVQRPPAASRHTQRQEVVFTDSLDNVMREFAPGPRYYACDTLLSDPRGGLVPWQRRGCLLQFDDAAGTGSTIAERLSRWFEGRGWWHAIPYSADGPDGTMFGFVHDTTLCIVEGRWDGGDDADSTYVPRPGYELIIKCVQAVRADTAQ